MLSSESEDESTVQFQEAIDHEFISNIKEKVNGGSEKLVPSLRPQPLKTYTNELKVTPEFQKHIAKHLDVIVKRQIKEVSGANRTFATSLNGNNYGIRLFSNSKVRICSGDLEPEVPHQNPCRTRKKKLRKSYSTNLSCSDESADELERLSSVAVSPEWVLLKKGAYGKCEKGKVIRLIDSGCGHLVERPIDSCSS